MDIRVTPLESDCFYHIYNRGINGEVIFKTDRKIIFIYWSELNLRVICKTLSRFRTLTRLMAYIPHKIYFQNDFQIFLILTPKHSIRKTIVMEP